MRRILLLLLVMLLPLAALGEEVPEADLALLLPQVTSAEAVAEYLLMPSKYNLSGIQRGYIRYIGQNEDRDDMFRTGYWLGGEKGSVLDLTLTERYGVQFPFHAMNMCSRAAYSMALSYLGIDITPGGMSEMMGTRNLNEPYDDISTLVGVERVQVKKSAFNTMVSNYLTDDSYSPVYLYFRRPNGACHAVLVVATIPEKSRYLVLDSNPPKSSGKLHRIYFISLNPARTEIVNSTFRDELKGSKVLQIHQWRLIDETAPAAEQP